MRNFIYIILALIGLGSLGSCISDDFSTSPSDILSFSSETVTFDTVFTDVGTTTARLRVYNKAKKSINISRIAFRNPSSNFSLNVDGVSGTVFNDVEIRGGDSIFIFIECFIEPDASMKPFRVSDELEFLTNGVTQTVAVEAWGLNVNRLFDFHVSSDMTFTADRPYLIMDSIVVEQGATLRIEPGAQLLFHDKAGMTVRGTLEAVGDPGKIIQLRGDRIDDVLPGVPYDIMSGQWKGIRIAPESFGNRLEYVDMRSTEEGLIADSCGNYSDLKLTIINSWLHNSQNNVLRADFCRTASYGVCYSDAAGAVVRLRGGVHEVSQCTFANEYLFSMAYEAMLTLEHILPEDFPASGEGEPLMKGEIVNSVFYGRAADITPGDLTGSEVFLRYCSLYSSGSNDDNFIDCFWDINPLFLTIRDDYYFNYHVAEDSPVIGLGDPELVAPQTLTDMDGVNRLENGNPTLGAYAK